ncbi:LysR family transcriptional regulator [Bradyrhizobium genosp. P]|uniref:LysR family transcriptional regulator n=1 Tax=Bradyrhizobium genosp. P TaxID=83641 RepID=UPI003CFBC0C0
MDRLEAMTILVAAVDTGSLSAASRHLRIPLATVSRRVSELEEHLNVRLLHRGNRKLVLTDIGRSYVAACRRIKEEIAEIERAASGEYRAPQGELIITAPAVLGRSHLLPIVVEFLRAFPDIRMRLQLTDRHANLVEEHVDLAVRIGELPDGSTIAMRVGAIRLVLCASPAYLKKRGTPKQPVDLAAHDCVIHEGHATSYNWGFFTEETAQTIQVPSHLAVNLGEAAVAAAVAGAGIARVLSYLIDDLVKSRSLVKLLEAYEPPPIPISLIYPSQRQVPLKLRAFLDFSIPRLQQRLGYKNT